MLKDKLNRMGKQIAREKKKPKPPESNRFQKLTDRLEGELVKQFNGSFIKITTDFDRYYSHGKFLLDDLPLDYIFNKEHFHNCDKPKNLPPKELLFFDMETTGLGGAGTIPFLIGFGSITDEGFQVRQYFLPDFPDEEAMLTAVREEITDETIIVSYNGKSFDMPILTDRFILHRIERELTIGDHIDLLFMARRMYRRRLQSCTLSNIEDKILDFHRYDDTPGYLVPSIYFGWLNYDETEELAGVIKHNLDDIVSLLFLMHHFSEIREKPDSNLSEPDDILSLARIYDSRKEPEEVTALLKSFEDITIAHKRDDIRMLQALSFKRTGNWQNAIAIWNLVIENDNPETFFALIELAKYHEHKTKEFQRALQLTARAEALIPPKELFRIDISKRINRLNRKISRHSS